MEAGPGAVALMVVAGGALMWAHAVKSGRSRAKLVGIYDDGPKEPISGLEKTKSPKTPRNMTTNACNDQIAKVAGVSHLWANLTKIKTLSGLCAHRKDGCIGLAATLSSLANGSCLPPRPIGETASVDALRRAANAAFSSALSEWYTTVLGADFPSVLSILWACLYKNTPD